MNDNSYLNNSNSSSFQDDFTQQSNTFPLEDIFENLVETEQTVLEYDNIALDDKSNKALEKLFSEINDTNIPFQVDYWHIANILQLLGASTVDVDQLMKDTLENGHLSSEIYIEDECTPNSLKFVIEILSYEESKQILITTLNTNYTDTEVDSNQIYDITNSWNSDNFSPTVAISDYKDNEYTVQTKQIYDITHGASINQLYTWINNAISMAFQAQRGVKTYYIDL